METIEPCELLQWDTEFFGLRIARVIGHRLNPQRTKNILDWCKTQAVKCLYFLADPSHQETVRLAEGYGFYLVDIRVTLECQVKKRQIENIKEQSEKVKARPCRSKDTPILQKIARTSYGDSRFYFDPGFPTESCHKLYQTWIKRSCEGYADVVFVAEFNSQPVGYISCHLLNDKSVGQIGLLGVSSQASGRKIGQILVHHSLDWFAEEGVGKVRVVTQGRNIAAQRLYQRCGFLTCDVQLWYHKWFSNQVSEETR
jgi:dTDP-4-amino-4,6-dideoxy-D-galactose acyltransferase